MNAMANIHFVTKDILHREVGIKKEKKTKVFKVKS